MKNTDGFHDLGEEYPKTCCDEPTSEEASNVHYPSLYFSGKQADAFKSLPPSGEAVIRFKKVSESTRTDRKGETTYSVELEIHAIKPGKESEVGEDEDEEEETPSIGFKSDEDAIEKGLQAAENDKD